MDLNNQQSETRNKEKEVFITAYDQNVDQIFRFIYFKVGNKEEAQDLTSATFLKAWNYLLDNRINPNTIKAFLYKIARNSVIDYYRAKSGYGATSLEKEGDMADDKQDISLRAELTSDIAIIENGLLKLKDEYREVIILRYTEEFSIAEIAEILEKSKTNTRVLVFRALRALREIINNNANTANWYANTANKILKQIRIISIRSICI
jgi:RNA polymerase sigma-70 factor (ECF subfamily)